MASATFKTDTLHEEKLEDLILLRDQVTQAIDAKREEAKTNLLAEFEQKAASLGIDLAELTRKKTKQSRGKVPPKYRNDLNHTETWTGRGRQPKWLTERLETGVVLDSLLISA